MPSLTTVTPHIPLEDLESFSDHLKTSTRILALLGAGLSASSGLPTFRGAGGYWRTYEATLLATPQAFQNNPALVWQFYSYRRHMALRARPNRAHLALSELARQKPEFLTISQNVDGRLHGVHKSQWFQTLITLQDFHSELATLERAWSCYMDRCLTLNVLAFTAITLSKTTLPIR